MSRFSSPFLFLALALAGPASAQTDWGDAPNSYGTTLVANGPRHTISPLLRLGADVDAEANGVPSLATADDAAGVDDEDGVQIFESPDLRIAGGQIGAWSQLQVSVHRAPAVATVYLNAWCDLNSDGDFADAGEQIATNANPVDGLNTFGFFVPMTAPIGASVIRVRVGTNLLPPGAAGTLGFGGLGEVEDHRIDFVAPSQATNVLAYARDGQVWISWDFNLASAAQVYEVYSSPLAMNNIGQGTLVARLFPDDYCGRRLVGELTTVFGAGANANFTIPNPVGAGTTTLAANRGLCVETVRGLMPPRYYAVVPRGQQVVPPASLSPQIPVTLMSLLPADSPACHVQQTGVQGGRRLTFYAVWGDGDDNAGVGRPDFPLMGNTARRAVPHHFFSVAADPLPPAPRPMAISFHGGNSLATSWRPGQDIWEREGGDFPEGISISQEDHVAQILEGRPESITSRWLGWVPTWDPFENRPPLPPNGTEIQPYMLNRLNWTLAWLKTRSSLDVDPNRVALRGYSAGSTGALLWAHTSPQHFSHLALFSPPLHWLHNWPDREPLYGTDAQNLRIAGYNSASGNSLRMRDTKSLTEMLAANVSPPPTQIYSGKRDQWWSIDYEADFEPDTLQEILAADSFAGALGVRFFWDQRQHGPENWMLSGAGIPGPGCPAWTADDFWIPTELGQTRRDDVVAHQRFRNDRSYPAFHGMQNRRATHGDPGTVDYGTPPVPFQQLTDRDDPPYSGPNTDPCSPWLPETLGDRRGTWGGYFDWFTPASLTDPDAQIDIAGQWATSVTLVKDTDANGMALPDIDDSPLPALVADVAIRRAQAFLPATGTQVTWMNVDRDTNRVTQSGIDTVGARGFVRMPGVIVPRLPRKARLIAATSMDFGDAPAGYPVTLAEDGARHATNTLLRLGSGRTLETDGTHHATAQLAAEGDNGVTGPAQWQANTVVTLTITVNAACRLDAWVDWARNGQWSGAPLDAKDQIAAALPLTAGANTLAIAVPNPVVPGASFARFRVSTGGCLAPTGPAPDGEVEDYPLVLTAAGSGLELDLYSTMVGGNIRLNWTGNSAWSYRIEYSTDLVKWLPALHPAAETTGPMFVTIPPALMEGPRRFFRVMRDPLVNSSVACAPGSQLGLSFVHTNGSNLISETTGLRVSSSIARNYHVYVPDNWNPSRTWPLVLMLHGTSMTGASLAATQAELRAIANTRGYITVFPDSTGNSEFIRWFHHPDPALIQPGNPQPFVDDKAFLFALMNHLVQNTGLRVDASRLYCAGFSNGAAMTHWIASDPAHPFRAFAIMDGLAAVFSMFEPRVAFDAYGRFGGTLPDFPVALPRPCLLMNLVTSEAVAYNGNPIEDINGAPVDVDNDGDFDTTPSAREAVQRWLTANGLPPAPTTLTRQAFINDPNWTPTNVNLALLPSSENHFFRPDAWWPAARKALYLAAYAEWPDPEIPDSLRLPAQDLPVSWFQNVANWQNLSSYPHITFTQNGRTYTVAGTWSEEIWPTPIGQSDREVRFYTLSDGGHQWPSASDRVGWDAQLGVMDFFDAH